MSRPPSGTLRPSRSASAITTESEIERKQEQAFAAEAFEAMREEQAAAQETLAMLRGSTGEPRSTGSPCEMAPGTDTPRIDDTANSTGQAQEAEALQSLDTAVGMLSSLVERLVVVCMHQKEGTRRSTEVAEFCVKLGERGIQAVRDEVSLLVDETGAIKEEGLRLAAEMAQNSGIATQDGPSEGQWEEEIKSEKSAEYEKEGVRQNKEAAFGSDASPNHDQDTPQEHQPAHDGRGWSEEGSSSAPASATIADTGVPSDGAVADIIEALASESSLLLEVRLVVASKCTESDTQQCAAISPTSPAKLSIRGSDQAKQAEPDTCSL